MSLHLTHRTRSCAVTVAGLAAAMALGVSAASAASPRQPAARHGGTIHLVEHELGRHMIDQGRPGISKGDRMLITSDLFDPAGKKAGRADFECVATGKGARGGGLCLGVIALAGGQLTTQFSFGASGESPRQAITGGTGRYASARGQFVITEGQKGGELVEVQLSR
jgi:hypothetical protein